MDHGARIAYTVLAEGTPVLASDGIEIGKVKRVLADDATDIFDGITIDAKGERFVDATQIEDLFERAVVLSLDTRAAGNLPEHSPSPAVIDVDPDTIAGDGPGAAPRSFVRRAWNRISGNY
jgi:hypothetical protein